jgi:quinol monooxygenase YgiN
MGYLGKADPPARKRIAGKGHAGLRDEDAPLQAARAIISCAPVQRIMTSGDATMTILVLGHIKTAPGDAARIKDLLAAHVARVEQEDGCEFYAFSFDVADPDLIRIAERWASEDALAAHGQADHQKAFGRALRDLGVVEMSVKTWDGTFSRTLIGD